jgi:hypothetical protein
VSDFVDRHQERLVALLAAAGAIGGGGWLLLLLRRRRLRGRWGLLQDRFAAAAVRRGARPGAPNPDLACAWPDVDAARLVAAQLDRAAFDPSFRDEDALYRETRELVGSLPGRSQ